MSEKETSATQFRAIAERLDARRASCWSGFCKEQEGKDEVTKLTVVHWGAEKLLLLFHEYGLINDLAAAKKHIADSKNWEKKFAFMIMTYFGKPYEDYNTEAYIAAELESLPEKLRVFGSEIEKLQNNNAPFMAEALNKGAGFALRGTRVQKCKFVTAMTNIVFVLIKGIS